MSLKKLLHVGCNGTVSKKTLVCFRCGNKPDGSKVVLVRQNRQTHRNFREASRRFEMMIGPDHRREDQSFNYPRQ